MMQDLNIIQKKELVVWLITILQVVLTHAAVVIFRMIMFH